MDTPPHGLLITQVKGYPDGLLAIPDKNGSPRIIVPNSQVEGLVLQCHEDIHHQSHVKVLHILKSIFYWPGMSAEVERICTACQTCLTASVRRKHLKTKFDLHAPQSTAMPRQDYGIDFYGVYKGEIMVIVDLFTRETILTHLNNRTQEGVALTILKHVFSTRRSTITPNGQRPRTIIPYGSSISNL